VLQDVVGFVDVFEVVFEVHEVVFVVLPYPAGVPGRAETKEVRLKKAMAASFMAENMLNDCR
jgi:hypothetical protein